jgi:XTP/dITP diphosphohydrolase
MKIEFVTTNRIKVESLEDALKRLNVLDVVIVQNKLELPEPRSDEIRTIAKEKSKYAQSVINGPFVVEDAGFFIQSLNGFPKAFVNFALETIGIEGILRLVEGKSRLCEFRQCLAYTNPSQYPELQYFESVSLGTLSDKPRGESKRALHRIFIPNNYEKTLAEMTAEEREQRTRASNGHYMQFAEWLKHHARK